MLATKKTSTQVLGFPTTLWIFKETLKKLSGIFFPNILISHLRTKYFFNFQLEKSIIGIQNFTKIIRISVTQKFTKDRITLTKSSTVDNIHYFFSEAIRWVNKCDEMIESFCQVNIIMCCITENKQVNHSHVAANNLFALNSCIS